MNVVPGRVLVADDDASVRLVLARAMRDAAHEVTEVADGDAAAKAIEESAFDVALVDVRMPGRDGFAVLDVARARGEAGPSVILLTALDEGKHAIEAMKRGAWDYLAKPFDVDEVEILVARAIAARRLSDEVRRLRGDPTAEPGTPDSGMVGKSRAMREVFKAIGRVAPTLETVLLTGPSGSGKELVARALHAHSPRAGAPFLAVNCAAIPSELLESELFGATRGAFTGAVADRPGRFQAARGGTLLLDEIGELPKPLQAKLLRAVQTREVTPLGATAPVKVDVRILAATNVDLAKLVEDGGFRPDLYYRLRVVEIELPPLEQRREDIPLLAEYFARKTAREAGVPAKSIAPKALEWLSARRWPGNVRELENAVRRAVVQSRGDTLTPGDFEEPPPPISAEEEGSLEEIVRRKLAPFVDSMASTVDANGPGDLHATVLAIVERPLIELALAKTKGNRVRAAKLLGLNRNTLHARIKALGIDGEKPARGRRARGDADAPPPPSKARSRGRKR